MLKIKNTNEDFWHKLNPFRIYAKPKKYTAKFLSNLIILILIIGYGVISEYRHKENPKEKITPSISQMYNTFIRYAFEIDKRTDERILLKDTKASTKRFIIGVALLFFGVILGLNMGVFPIIECIFFKFISGFEKIPALSYLPILFVVFGDGELTKIVLMFIGCAPTICLDTHARVKAFPNEQIIKGKTLGASDFEIAYRIVLPEIIPSVLYNIALTYKSVWLFLIASESIAASSGLGYRIFVVQRYMAMDVIIPYDLWIGFLAYVLFKFTIFVINKRYPWMNK